MCSTSGAPTPPNPTPRTEALDDIDSPPRVDLADVGRILGPIEEDLNESADAAMYPSPPINTPETFSPAPSVKYGRGRGLSAIGDRLAQLKLEERSSSGKDADVTSSNRSAVASIAEDDGEDVADDMSSTGKYSTAKAHHNITSASSLISPTAGSIPIMLGSPRINPLIEEYLNFNSHDLPVSNPDKKPTSSTEVPPEGSHSRGNSIKSDGAVSGVSEKTNWAEEVEDYADRAIMQLEQLALDEFIADPSRSIEDHYVARLKKLLAAAHRKAPVEVSKMRKEAGE